MTTIVLLFFIALVLRKTLLNITNTYKKDISSTNDMSAIMTIRKKAKRTRILFLSFYSVLFILFFLHKYEYLLTDMPILVIMSILLYIVFIWIIMEKNDIDGVTSKASTMSLNQIPDKFILYLRGFEQDVYSSHIIIEGNVNNGNFSEHLLSEYFVDRIPFIAVGMTKELWQPSGARRIYVDDKSWKDDVRFLMDKSLCNIILVNDRTSCIWEIEQSKTFLSKTIFIIDSIEKYNNVKTIVKQINMPDIENSNVMNGFFFTTYDNETEILPFNPSSKYDYKKLSQFITKRFGINGRLINRTILLYTSGIISSTIIFVMGLIRLLSCFDTKVIIIMIISLLSLFYFVFLLIKK